MNQELDIQKIGIFLSTLRKELRLTQKNLGDMVGVTNKAVSKWERGISLPDISLLPKIAEIFDVTIEELIVGEHKSSVSSYQEEMNDIINKTMEYSNTSFNLKKRKILFLSLSILALFTCFLNLLANFITNKSAISTLALAGIIVVILLAAIPIIFNHKYMIEKAFVIFLFSLLIYIYLFLYIEKVSETFLSLALPTAFINCLTIYTIVKSFLHFRKNLFYAFCFSLVALCIGPLFLTNLIVIWNGIERYDDVSQSIAPAVLVVISIFLFICGYLKNKNIGEVKTVRNQKKSPYN